MLQRNNKYFKWGLTGFLVLVAAVLFWLIFSNLGGVYALILDFLKIISSLLYGCVFAYLMNPILQFAERCLYKLFRKTKWKDKRKDTVVKWIAVTLTVLIFVAAIYALIAMIAPSIYTSIVELVSAERLQGYYNTVMNWVHGTFEGTPLGTWMENNFEDLMNMVANYLKNLNLLQILLGAFSSVYSVMATVFNMLIGVIAGVYILVYKRELCAQTKKLAIAVFRTERADRFFTVARRTNRIFSGYVIGKLIDAMFVGVVTYIALLIMDVPFAPLISVLVGATNIIPFFGPFIGAIPSVILLLIENPVDAVYFGIFILILQIIDGNIIENRILGEKLGISDFWVLVSILISGGVFGFMGMLIGVPIFAVVYTLIADGVNKRLRKKRLPTDTDLYCDVTSVTDLPVVEKPLPLQRESLGYDRNAEEDSNYED